MHGERDIGGSPGQPPLTAEAAGPPLAPGAGPLPRLDGDGPRRTPAWRRPLVVVLTGFTVVVLVGLLVAATAAVLVDAWPPGA